MHANRAIAIVMHPIAGMLDGSASLDLTARIVRTKTNVSTV